MQFAKVMRVIGLLRCTWSNVQLVLYLIKASDRKLTD